jgi:N-carbamoylputrescine amidase
VTVRLAAAQLPACSDDLDANRLAAEIAVRTAAAAGAAIVALPELATVPYFCGGRPEEYRAWAEAADGPLAARFAALARECRVTLFFPFYERDRATGRFHNSVLGFAADGRQLRDGPVARKLHLPVGDDPPPGFDEPAHFAAGESLHVVEAAGLKTGVLVCYDRRFPEAWRALRAKGAELVIVPVAGSGGDDMNYFIGEMRTHARENGLAVLCANKVGDEHVGGGVVDNYGYSTIIDADGAVLALRPAMEGPGLAVADIDQTVIAATRRRLRYYEHRREDLYRRL